MEVTWKQGGGGAPVPLTASDGSSGGPDHQLRVQVRTGLLFLLGAIYRPDVQRSAEG